MAFSTEIDSSAFFRYDESRRRYLEVLGNIVRVQKKKIKKEKDNKEEEVEEASEENMLGGKEKKKKDEIGILLILRPGVMMVPLAICLCILVLAVETLSLYVRDTHWMKMRRL